MSSRRRRYTISTNKPAGNLRGKQACQMAIRARKKQTLRKSVRKNGHASWPWSETKLRNKAKSTKPASHPHVYPQKPFAPSRWSGWPHRPSAFGRAHGSPPNESRRGHTPVQTCFVVEGQRYRPQPYFRKGFCGNLQHDRLLDWS